MGLTLMKFLSKRQRSIPQTVSLMRADIAKEEQRQDRLRNMDLFVLDNSIRESAVGQLRGHTLEDKIKIYEQVEMCGIASAMIIASLGHIPSVDEDFCQWVIDSGQDRSRMYAFSEISEGLKGGAYDTETVPISLQKNKKYGLANTFFEVELANKDCKWGEKFTMKDFCRLLLKRIMWVHDHIAHDGSIMVNVIDLPTAMEQVPERVYELVIFLAQLPARHHITALCFEDPIGESQSKLQVWTKYLRQIMDSNGWSSGKLLVHIHDKLGVATALQLECLNAGADGVWASLCEDGALVGHASSTLTLMNMIHRGNEKVQVRYNCQELRKAAYNISKITTGRDPDPMQVVYGERALDVVFEYLGTGNFSLAHFFDEKAPQRITTTATSAMIKQRLNSLFGEHPQFTDEVAQVMLETIHDNLRRGRKEEYMTECAISVLFIRSGGKLNAAMKDVLGRVEVTVRHHRTIISDVKFLWDQWAETESSKGHECLRSICLSNLPNAHHFECLRCQDTEQICKVLNAVHDSGMDWEEYLVYIKWALIEYPETETAAEAMSIALEKGIIPALQNGWKAEATGSIL